MSKPAVVNPLNLKELRVELWISAVLRVGVTVSLVLVLFGLVLCFFHHPQHMASKQTLDALIAPGAAFPRPLPDDFAGVADFRGQAIIAVGLLVLILAPIMRVVIFMAALLEERDWLVATITATVLVILQFSFWLGEPSRVSCVNFARQASVVRCEYSGLNPASRVQGGRRYGSMDRGHVATGR